MPFMISVYLLLDCPPTGRHRQKRKKTADFAYVLLRFRPKSTITEAFFGFPYGNLSRKTGVCGDVDSWGGCAP